MRKPCGTPFKGRGSTPVRLFRRWTTDRRPNTASAAATRRRGWLNTPLARRHILPQRAQPLKWAALNTGGKADKAVAVACGGGTGGGRDCASYIAHAAATTAEVWWVQGFAQEEDIAFKAMIADYEKASGNTIDHSIVPFAA